MIVRMQSVPACRLRVDDTHQCVAASGLNREGGGAERCFDLRLKLLC